MRTLAKVWLSMAIPTIGIAFAVVVVRDPTLQLASVVFLFCAVTLAAAIYLVGTK